MMENQGKLRVGIIGLGVGAQHLTSYLKDPRVQVTKICDQNEDVLFRFKTEYPQLKATPKDFELLEDGDIDLLSICSYDSDHHQQVIKALKNNKHVFVEKPLCLNFKEAKDIKDLLSQRPHLHLSSNLILRRYPRFQKLKEIVESDQLGEIFYIDADYNYGRREKIEKGWRGQIPGYSPVLGGGVHLVDLIYWLTNQRPVEVSAFGNKIATARSSYKYFDLTSALFRYENGLVAKVTVNLGCVYPHFHRFSAYGTRATFENDFEFGKIFKKGDPSREYKKITTDYPGALKGDLISSFIDEIQKGERNSKNLDDIFTVLSICYAFDGALKTGSGLKIEYL